MAFLRTLRCSNENWPSELGLGRIKRWSTTTVGLGPKAHPIPLRELQTQFVILCNSASPLVQIGERGYRSIGDEINASLQGCDSKEWRAKGIGATSDSALHHGWRVGSQSC